MFDITKYKVEHNPEETADLTITKFSTKGEKSSISISTKSFKEIMDSLDMTGDQTADYLFNQVESELDTEEEDTGLGFKSRSDWGKKSDEGVTMSGSITAELDEDTSEKLKSMFEAGKYETHSELAYKMVDFLEELFETEMDDEEKAEILETPKRYIGHLLGLTITHVAEDAEHNNTSSDVALFGLIRYLQDSEIFDKREIAYLVASMLVTGLDRGQATELVETVVPLYEIAKATGGDDSIVVLLFDILQSDFGMTMEKVEVEYNEEEPSKEDEAMKATGDLLGRLSTLQEELNKLKDKDSDNEDDEDSTIDSLLDELNDVKAENENLLAKVEAYKQRQRTLEKANNHLANRVAQIEKALKGE